MNNYQFKLVKVLGEFVWHEHPDADEVFIVLEGSLDTLFRDGEIILAQGEVFVIPKGVEHKPVAEQEFKLLLLEPKGVVDAGQAGGELLAAKMSRHKAVNQALQPTAKRGG